MKTRKTTLLLYTFLLVTGGIAKAEDPVVFNDPALETAVRETLGIPTGDIMPSDMLNLTELRAGGRSIADLTGIEYAVNLTFLDANRNLISDLSPLSALTELTSLILAYNQISDLGPLSALTELTSLILAANQINDLSPVLGLINLTELQLNGNQVSDLNPLAGLVSLTFLTLERNQISDLSPLAGLTNMQYVNLSGNQISDLGPVSGMTNLGDLWLHDNQISDLNPLSGLTYLGYLAATRNQISDLSPLSGLPNLSRLWLDSNQISDLNPLSGLTNLTEIRLPSNPISDLSPLTALMALKRLRLTGCPLSWQSYCLWLVAIQANNPGLTDLQVDPNPYNCDCLPEPTPEGSSVVVTPTDNTTGTTPATLTFEQVTAAGGTTLVTSTSGPTPPPGFQLGDPATYYSITTTASYTGLIDVCISYVGVSFPPPPEALRLMHYEDGQWVDCTTVVDPQNEIVCGVVTSLSPFAIMLAEDITPPVFESLSATPNVLWPPNHKMIPITITWAVSDNLDPAPTVVLKSITMNEGDETNTYDPAFDTTIGDGHTISDIQIDVDGNIFLRAERAGTGTGRTYTLTYAATDFSGNTATAIVIVTVPHEAP